jgi:Protein of unknown function (DUF3305)
MPREVSISVGVVVAKVKIDHKWADWSWRPVAVIPGAPPIDEWREIASGEGWTHYHCGTVPLTLYRSDTEAYRVALSDNPPRVYVVLRHDEEGDEDRPYFVETVTASPYEAQDFQDSAEDLVEAVPMPPGLIAWVQAFIDEHHVDKKFVKRRRDRVDPDAQKFGKEPIFSKHRRGGRNAGGGKD